MGKDSEIKKVRLFFGTHIDPDVIYANDGLDKIEQYFNCSMKFVEKENIHMTWKFIGDVAQDKVDGIIATVQEILASHADIKIRFQEFAVWPNGKFPRQLVITGNDLNGEGAKLYKELNRSLAKVGIEKEKRSFNPHITAARFRIKGKPEKPFILPEWLKFNETVARFSSMDLIQSTITPKGSIYKSIQTFQL